MANLFWRGISRVSVLERQDSPYFSHKFYSDFVAPHADYVMLEFPLSSVYSHSIAENPAQALSACRSLRLATNLYENAG